MSNRTYLDYTSKQFHTFTFHHFIASLKTPKVTYDKKKKKKKKGELFVENNKKTADFTGWQIPVWL